MGRRERWKDAVFGNYDWRFLCMPTPPWKKSRATTPYFGKDEKIPLSVALVMGLQHALAMVGGIIISPLLIASTGFTPEGKTYLVSASLIVLAFSTFVQIAQLKIPFTKYVIGSGMLSTMGMSFSFLPVVEKHARCASCTFPLKGNCLTAEQAYGKVLGTVLLVCWYQVAVSFCPPRILRRIFPPIVTGIYLILLEGHASWSWFSAVGRWHLLCKPGLDKQGIMLGQWRSSTFIWTPKLFRPRFRSFNHAHFY